jgi:hypothetical protein
VKSAPPKAKAAVSALAKPRRIFVSHSNKDKKLASQLAADLKAAGFDIWYDSDDIRVGDNILEKIEQGLSECDNMIIILSPHALRSWMVRQELIFFRNEERRRGRNVILPVLYKDCDIPRWLETRHYADFRRDYKIGIVALRNSLRNGHNQAQKP